VHSHETGINNTRVSNRSFFMVPRHQRFNWDQYLDCK